MARTLSIGIIAIDEASATFAKISAQADATGKTIGKTSTSFSNFASTVSKTTLLAGAAVAVVSLKMATDFQKQMTLLQTAGGETAKNMKTVSNGILDLAVSTGTSTTQLAAGMYIVEKAGYQGANGLLVLKAAAQGAKAENVDLGTATTALTSVMMSYHMKASQAVSTENMLVAGAGKAKTTMQEYAGALSTVIPVASAAGINFAQVAGAIATLTQHGTSADESTQELANTIRNLQAPSAVAQKAMQQVGLNVTDVTTKLGQRGLTGTIQLITNAIATKLGPQGTVLVDTMMKSTTGTQDLNLMLSKMPAKLKDLSQGFLTGKVSMSTYRADFRGMGADGSAMGTQFMSLAQQVKGYNAQVKAGGAPAVTAAAALKNIMGGATGMNTALMLGGANMKTFTADTNLVAAAGAKSGANISTWAKTQATLSVKLDQAREMVEVLAIRIGTQLIPIVISILGWMTKHRQIIMDVAIALAGLAVGITAIKIAMAAWTLATQIATAATFLWNVALSTNPIILIVLGLAALGVAIYEAYKHFKPFREAVNDVGHAFAWLWNSVLSPVVDFLKKNWKTALEIAVVAILPFMLAPVLIFRYWHQILDFFEALPGEIMGYLKDAGKWLLGIGKDAADGLIAGLKLEFVTLPRDFYRWVVANGGLIGIGKKLLADLVTGVRDGWSAIVSFFTAAPGVIGGYLKTAGTWLLAGGKFLITGLWTGITTGASAVWSFFTGLPARIEGYAADAHEWLFVGGKNILVGAWNGITTGATDVWKFFTGLPNRLLGYAKQAATWLVQMGKDIVTGIIHGIESMAGALAKGLKNVVTGGLKDLGKVGSGAAKFLGLATGGLVPGAIGAPVPAVVHGGEYMLSRGMLTGQSPIEPSVVAALLSNIAKSNTGMATLSAQAQYNNAATAMSGMPSLGNGGAKQQTNNFYITGQSDPVGSANAVQRRLVSSVI